MDASVLERDIALADERLDQVTKIYGHDSEEYQQALQRFTRLWAMMRMRRRPNEFLPERRKTPRN